MDIFESVLQKVPGCVKDDGEKVVIDHDFGQCSTFYKAKNNQYELSLPKSISDIYAQFETLLADRQYRFGVKWRLQAWFPCVSSSFGTVVGYGG